LISTADQPDEFGAFGALGSGAEHLRRVSRCVGNPAHGRAQLWPQGHALRVVHPDSAALPSILAGLKIGWAFAWRTLIAAEPVFGATSGKGGLGWYIFQNRNELYTDMVFAGLAVVILIGLLMENLVFDSLERVTVRGGGGSCGETISTFARTVKRCMGICSTAAVLKYPTSDVGGSMLNHFPLHSI
jgi:hypothetical protein